jgi:hypothetical protein
MALWFQIRFSKDFGVIIVGFEAKVERDFLRLQPQSPIERPPHKAPTQAGFYSQRPQKSFNYALINED